MNNKDVIKLEDNKDYIVMDIIDEYFYLVNNKDARDFCIRKLKTMDDPTLIMLSSNNEFDKALKLFSKKYKK